MNSSVPNSNPLKAFYRKPGIWISLPSGGKYYKTPPHDLNDMGEIPIYPMTAKDELALKNADGLLNGSAITQLIKSCAPSIDDPQSMPAVDLDAILVAIKRCTYGETITISATHDCEGATESEYSIDLNNLIGSIEPIGDIEPVKLSNDISVYILPISIKNILQLNWAQYEEVRKLQMIEDKDISEEERVNTLQKSYEVLSNAGIRVVVDSIDLVQLPDGTTVNDKAMINDWVIDLPKSEYALLEKSILTTNSKGIKKDMTLRCSHCNQEFISQLDLNPTTFFA